MNDWQKAVVEVVKSLTLPGAKKATRYLSPRRVVRATLRSFDRKMFKEGHVEIVLTIGRPNYEERAFIKRAGGAKAKFPMHDTQMKPKSKAKTKAKK